MKVKGVIVKWRRSFILLNTMVEMPQEEYEQSNSTIVVNTSHDRRDVTKGRCEVNTNPTDTRIQAAKCSD